MGVPLTSVVGDAKMVNDCGVEVALQFWLFVTVTLTWKVPTERRTMDAVDSPVLQRYDFIPAGAVMTMLSPLHAVVFVADMVAVGGALTVMYVVFVSVSLAKEFVAMRVTEYVPGEE